ncbi:MAG: macro domain-containing protein [Candidatus Hatepunaea meridiana]|nr:macro domain-containing protein [Candidatus Hatepunaea meridiana]
MIELKKGNLLTADVEALVNSVNCVGIMGRGIALQFRKAFTDNFKEYADACKRGEILPGQMFVFKTGLVTFPHYILNFPTKRHWRGNSRMSDIESGLKDLVSVIKNHRISSIAIPPLGCGLGGLDWEDVRSRIENVMSEIPEVHVLLYEPSGAPEMVKSRDVPGMTPGRAALIGLMHHYLSGLMEPFISLLEIHKLMYFMQEAGEPLRLKFSKALYGPYAENLRHVLNSIEGHLIAGYADGGDSPDKQISIVPGATEDAKNFLEDNAETQNRFERVTELVQGFETPFGLELLSSVHWVVSKENAKTAEKAIEKTYSWNERKRRFVPDQIRLALSTLISNGWVRDYGGGI